MTLKRKTIRQYIVSQLLASPQTSAGNSVHSASMFPVKTFPFINVFITSEEEDRENPGHSQFHKVKKGTIEIWVMMAPSVDRNIADDLDDLCEQITGKLDPDRHLGGNATCCEYDNTKIMFNPDAVTPHAIASITYNLEYI